MAVPLRDLFPCNCLGGGPSPGFSLFGSHPVCHSPLSQCPPGPFLGRFWFCPFLPRACGASSATRRGLRSRRGPRSQSGSLFSLRTGPACSGMPALPFVQAALAGAEADGPSLRLARMIFPARDRRWQLLALFRRDQLGVMQQPFNARLQLAKIRSRPSG